MATSLQPSVAPGASGDGGYHSHDGPLYDDEDDAAYDFYSDSGGETSDDVCEDVVFESREREAKVIAGTR